VMASVEGKKKVRTPNPSWMRLEYAQELTGNTAKANAVVIGINTFTLTAAATSPWFIFPRLGLGGPAAFVGLVLVPVVFSVLFFAGPLVRMVGVKMENRRREARNIRRVLLGLVYDRALGSGQAISVDEAFDFVGARLEKQVVRRGEVESVLHDLAAELDADVSPGEDGVLRFTFDAIRAQFAASEVVRRKLRLENRRLGDIVFSTSDSAEESTDRELALFDRQLDGGDVDLDRYLPTIDRIDFEDDYEIVAFDDELKQRGVRPTQLGRRHGR